MASEDPSKEHPLVVKKVPTGKNKIPQVGLADEGLIPKHPFRWMLSGQSASGKSTLLANILKWYKNGTYFNRILAIGPTVKFDDLWKAMKIPDEDLIEKPDEGTLTQLLAEQEQMIKKVGITKAPRVLLIFEDIISHQKFMRTQSFTRCFVAGRHFGVSTIILTQKYNGVPRVCRLQASHISFFPSKLTEVDILADDHAPPNMSKRDFKGLIQFATEPKPGDTHPFLYIDVFAAVSKRFRRNMFLQIQIPGFETEASTSQKPQEATSV